MTTNNPVKVGNRIWYHGECSRCGKTKRFCLPMSEGKNSNAGRWYKTACCSEYIYCEELDLDNVGDSL